MALSEIVEEDEVDLRVDVEKFKNFDIVTDVSDHFYLFVNHKKHKKSKITVDQQQHDCLATTYKKIMTEWKILGRDLPDSIYVRAYETRIDLLRAAIVGPAGTPYHDGIFFFDIAFPPDYPTKPPLVHYHSFGLRINPNLYKMVLVSIQAMVLNTEPFYNEPGMGIIINRHKQSSRYSENAFIKSCKTMVYLLRKPPMNFKDLVISHFQNRAPHILAACNAYMKGLDRIGEEFQVNALSLSTTSENTSSDFKRDMLPVYHKLLEAFMFAGDSVKSFVEEFSREEMAKGNGRPTLIVGGAARGKIEAGEKNSKKKKKFGVWNRIKGLFGLKKTGEKKSLVEVSN